MEELKMDSSYASRYVNDGFSGGERKKTEILQMCMLEPKLAMLDEIDSGLDVDAVRVVSQTVAKYHDEGTLSWSLRITVKFCRAFSRTWFMSLSTEKSSSPAARN